MSEITSEPQCEYKYNSGRLCNCEADFEVTPVNERYIERGIKECLVPWTICALHLGFYLMQRSILTYTVKRIVPREKRA